MISGVADRVPEKGCLARLSRRLRAGERRILFQHVAARPASYHGAGRDWLVAPRTSAEFGLKRPEVIALWEAKSTPHPLATLTQPVQLTGGIGRIKQKMYILATEPARFTRFYDKLKNDPGWTVHTLPCTHFIQLEMPDELIAILLKAIP